MKLCCKCKTSKPLDAFNKNASEKDGLQCYCADCYKAIKSANYAKNKEKILADAAAYYAVKKDAILARNAAYYERHKRNIRAKQAAWRSLNSAKTRRLVADWFIANPHMRSVYSNIRRARKWSAKGSFTPGDIQTLFALQNGKCACCRQPLGKSYHKDHINPLYLGGDNGKLNIQLLCPPCNLSKGRKHPVDFMQERGFLL